MKREFMRKRCLTCNKMTPAGKFCVECGSPLKKYTGVMLEVINCPKCSTSVPAKNYCVNCGTELTLRKV